jgi:hypothetical protein
MGGTPVTVWHKTMTPDKWRRFSVEQQILMIGSEFARAKNLLRDHVDTEVVQCYERAMELLDLCAMDPKWRHRLKELLRFRELLGELYLNVPADNGGSLVLYRTLMNWSGQTSRVEL